MGGLKSRMQEEIRRKGGGQIGTQVDRGRKGN